MYDDHMYNLLSQYIEERRSLWRIKQHYKDDSSGCDECQTLWDKLEGNKESEVEELEKLIETHVTS